MPECFGQYMRKVKESWAKCRRCRDSVACYRKSKGAKGCSNRASGTTR